MTATDGRDAPAVALGAEAKPAAAVLVALGDPGPARAHALERARAAVTTFGGRVELRDDGALVVTVSGTGGARDRARHAARCALALRDALGDDPMALLLASDASRGGEPVARALAMAGVAPASLAARRARPIALDATLAGLLDARFQVTEHAGLFALQRLRPGADAEAPRTLLGRPAPFVGRDREMATLEAVLRGSLEDGSAHVVLVTGPSGVGKSRLLREFLQGVVAHHDGVEVWPSRADPMSAGSPLSMVAQTVRAACGVRDSDTLRTSQARLSSRVGRHLAGDDGVRVTEFLGELAGIRFPEARNPSLRAARRSHALMGDQLRRAWQDFLAAECRAQPVVLVLEDLHWGDASTVSFLDTALRQLRDAPLLVLALGQPELHRLFPDLWSSHARTELRLGELSRKASEKLVREVMGDAVAAEDVARIATHAAGNAYYLEELIRATVERRPGLPPTVLAMVQARLDALEPDARRVLRAASVFGATFWRAGVAALLDASAGEPSGSRRLAALLDALVEHELVVRREAGRFPEELSFRHDLVRAASYATLTEADRALGHRLAGEWLERAGEGDAMALASHFERAGQGGRARERYARAAAQSLDGNDYAGAIARAEQALACGAEGAERGNLLALQAEALRWTSDFEAAAARLEQAVALLPEGSARGYDALSELVAARARTGRLQAEGAALVDRLAGAAPLAGAGASRVIALARAAVALIFAGQGELAAPLFAQLDAAPIEPGDRAAMGRGLQARATRAMAEGDVAAYLELTTASVREFDAVGDVRTACVQRNNAGYAQVMMGAVSAAESTLREAMLAADRMGLTSAAAIARQNLGLALAYGGALQEARAVEERSIEATTASGEALMTACGHAYLAEILSIGGNHDAAERAARTALELVGERPHEIRVLALAALARALLSTRRPALALAASEPAFALLSTVSGAAGEAAARLVYAEALRATGDEARARQVLRDAVRRLRARAVRIPDEVLRKGFLERVPTHARTLSLATEWALAD
jgi:tetratricopeptide (TPR) repeat protein/energy-coupling factor transporter ATP-binding protein EcfA2